MKINLTRLLEIQVRRQIAQNLDITDACYMWQKNNTTSNERAYSFELEENKT